MQETNESLNYETQRRERLFADPADTTARLELAWSLFLRAYRCASEAEIPPRCVALQEPETVLLKESLMQAAVAGLISPEAAARREALRLADKARELGAGDLAAQAERETQAMQRQLAAAVRRT